MHSSSHPYDDMKSAYFTFMAGLKKLSDATEPTVTHKFLKFLKDRSKIMRIYTQNIDGLEYRVGLVEDEAVQDGKKLIDVHGNLGLLSCTICSFETPFKGELIQEYYEGVGRCCPQCQENSDARKAKGKRSLPIGILTPSILLYNDHGSAGSSFNKERPNFTVGYKMSHVCEEIGYYMSLDAPKPTTPANRKRAPELVLVMGTSCKVIGIKKWIKTLAHLLHHPSLTSGTSTGSSCVNGTPTTNFFSSSKTTPKKNPLLMKESKRWMVYINKTAQLQKEWESVFDLQIIGDSDCICKYLEDEMRHSATVSKSLFKQEKLDLVQQKSSNIIKKNSTKELKESVFFEKENLVEKSNSVSAKKTTKSYVSRSNISIAVIV